MDVDLYSLFADDETTAKEQAAALAAALRGQQHVGSALATHPLLAQLGQGMQQRAAKSEGNLADAGQQKYGARLQELMRKRQQEFTAGENVMDRKLRGQELRERALDRAQQREFMLSTLGVKSQERQQVRDEAQLKELSEDVDKLGAPGFYQKHSEAKAIAAENPDDLPGVGAIAGRLPNWMISDEGQNLRQAAGQMLAEYRKGITGAGMSDSERVEYGEITGLLQGGDEDAFRKGMDRLQRAMDARVGNRAAGSPRASEDFGSRQPWFKDAVERSKGAPPGGGLDPTKKARLEELRRKRAAGEI